MSVGVIRTRQEMIRARKEPAHDRSRSRLLRGGFLSIATLYMALLSGKRAVAGYEIRWLLVTLAVIVFVGAAPRIGDMPIARPVRRFFGSLFLYFGVLIVSSVWAQPGARLVREVPDLLIMGVMTGIACVVFSALDVTALRHLVTLCAGVGYLYLLGALATGPGSQGRFSAFGGGPNVFVKVLFTGTVAVFLLSRGRRPVVRAALIIPLVIGMILSGSRGGLFAAAAAGLVAVLNQPQWRLRSTARLLMGVAGAVVVATYLLPAWIIGFVQERFVDATFAQRYTSGRDELFTLTFSLFRERPVYGFGLDSFYALIGDSGGYAYPHNLMLASAADAGILALIPLYLVLRRLFRALRPGMQGLDVSAFAAVNLVCYFLASNFSGDYYDSRFVWFFGALLLATLSKGDYAERGAP
jgi:O-antigen ligase